MKATLIALMLGGVLTSLVSSPATTYAVETLEISFTYTVDPTTNPPTVKVEIDDNAKLQGVVLRESKCTLDGPDAVNAAENAGVAASCATDPPDGRLGQAVLQLTYVPKGVRRLFNLVGIKVDQGPLGVGFQYGGGIGEGAIGVYYDLKARDEPHPLSASTGIDRVTLECASDSFPKCMSLNRVVHPNTSIISEGLHNKIRVKSLTLEIDPTADPAASARFVVLGDTGTIGSGKDETGQRTVAKALEEWCNVHGCNFALLLGDNFYDSGVGSCTDARFNTTFEEPYHTDLSKFRPEDPSTWPQPIQYFYSVLGNHDYGNGPFVYDKGSYQYQYANLKSGCKPSNWKRSGRWRMGNPEDPSYPVVGDPDPREPYRYYAFQQGNVQFLALDTTPMVVESWSDNTSRMRTYVNTQQDKLLKAMGPKDGRWKIAFGHHPYKSNGDHGNAGHYDGRTDDCPLTESDPNGWACGVRLKDFVDSMCEQELGLDLYLSGHDHNLQWLSAECGTKSKRRVEFIVSGAGAQLTDCTHGDKDPARPEFCQRQNRTEYQKKTLGFVYIVIKGPSMDVRFIDASNLAVLHHDSRLKQP